MGGEVRPLDYFAGCAMGLPGGGFTPRQRARAAYQYARVMVEQMREEGGGEMFEEVGDPDQAEAVVSPDGSIALIVNHCGRRFEVDRKKLSAIIADALGVVAVGSMFDIDKQLDCAISDLSDSLDEVEVA